MTVKTRPRGVAQFEQSVRDLSETLAAAKVRTSKLGGPTPQALAQDPAVLREALQELQVHQEELAVANEELRAQLDELGAARDRYRKLFELTPDSYFVTDLLGIIRDLNGAAARMLETEVRFLQGKPLVVLVDAADARMLRDAIDALRSEVSVDLELRFKRRTSEPEWHTVKAIRLEDQTAVLWFARSVQVAHDTRVALAGATHDARVVAKSAHTADLARANRDMEEILARERRLRTQLEQEHVAKDRFLAILSHDLRAPLNAVVGWAQLLRRERLDEAARDRALATIERGAQAQLRLVEEVLDISRLAADKVQLERVPVVLNELVQHAADAVATTALERGIALTVAMDSDRLVVAGDRARLKQVLSNLLSNALKFMPAGGGQITLSLRREGDEARIVVADNGRGISGDLVAHLFDPFEKGGDFTTAFGGVGLGLYIVRQCVLLHGGRVLAESDGPRCGARFSVVLPLTERFATLEEIVPRSSRGLGSGALEGIRVLVVDDEEDARELMAAVLRQHGAVVTVAADVPSALHVFDGAPPDVVLSDIALPGRNGLDLARELRARPAMDATLVAVSGFSGTEHVDRALTAGFDVHLAKPVDPAELVTVVRDAARLRSV
jgi:signal transduction histidine kinase/CheY-like chemotaxis protein